MNDNNVETLRATGIRLTTSVSKVTIVSHMELKYEFKDKREVKLSRVSIRAKIVPKEFAHEEEMNQSEQNPQSKVRIKQI